MRWRNALASMVLLTVFVTESFAAQRFAHAEYFAATPAGQKRAEPAGVKGTLVFDANSKKVEFLNPKGAPAFAIDYDAIHVMQYERIRHPDTWQRY